MVSIRIWSYADTHVESDDLRRIMLDSNPNVVAILVTHLGDSDVHVRGSAAQALVELAKHGVHSDPRAMQALI
jgi:hypothetical protein